MVRAFLKGSLAVVLLILSFAIPTAGAAERCVLVELFTHFVCDPCDYAEAALDSLTVEYPDSVLAIVRYQMCPGSFKKPECDQRWYYYSCTVLPTSFFDGLVPVYEQESDSAAYQAHKDTIEFRRTIPSPLSMSLSVSYDTLSRSGQADVQVIAVDPVAAEGLRLRYTLIESEIPHNDEVCHEFLRDMFPDADGVSFTIAQGDTFNDTTAFALDTLWVPENCALVAYVQDDTTREVLQSIQRVNSEWILPPPPAPLAIEDLTATLCESRLYLSWSEVTEDIYGGPVSVDRYRIYAESSSYVEIGTKSLIDSTTQLHYTDSTCGHVGDLSLNCSYYVTAVAGELESGPSNVVGEFDYYMWNAK